MIMMKINVAIVFFIAFMDLRNSKELKKISCR